MRAEASQLRAAAAERSARDGGAGAGELWSSVWRLPPPDAAPPACPQAPRRAWRRSEPPRPLLRCRQHLPSTSPPPPRPKPLPPCRWLDRPPPPYPNRRKKPSSTARSRRRRPTPSPPTPCRHGSRRRRRRRRPSRRLRLRPSFRPSPPPRAPGRQARRRPRPAPAPFRPAAPEGRSQPLDGQLLRGAQEVHREVQHGCEGGGQAL